MTASTSRPVGAPWSKLKRRLAELSPPELLRVVHELYDRSAENRRYLAAKLLDDQSHILDEYRERILAVFSCEDPRRTPRLGAGRKAIRDYWRATGDHEGTAELMLSYVEAGNRFSREHGDMSNGYYDSLAIVLRDLGEALRDHPELHVRFRGRLGDLRRDSRRVGWSWGGYVAELIERLETELGGD